MTKSTADFEGWGGKHQGLSLPSLTPPPVHKISLSNPCSIPSPDCTAAEPLSFVIVSEKERGLPSAEAGGAQDYSIILVPQSNGDPARCSRSVYSLGPSATTEGHLAPLAGISEHGHGFRGLRGLCGLCIRGTRPKTRVLPALWPSLLTTAL